MGLNTPRVSAGVTNDLRVTERLVTPFFDDLYESDDV